jgi:electron transport complex protein RnfG
MKEMIKIVAVLTGVCALCAGLLSITYGLAKNKIAANGKKVIAESLKSISRETLTNKEITINDMPVYELFDQSNNLIGYGFIAEGDGYQGKIKILAVINSNLTKLQGIEIIESSETPGLGAKICEPDFKQQFVDLNAKNIEYVKSAKQSDNQIVAITSATISSRSVVNILNKRIAILKTQLKK